MKVQGFQPYTPAAFTPKKFKNFGRGDIPFFLRHMQNTERALSAEHRTFKI
jgi:hypothetical protein